jgi:thiol-disulfide isomerase/thioredoxin
MSAPATRVALAVLLLAAGRAAAADAPPPAARALLDSLAARYTSLAAYQLSGYSRASMVQDSGEETNVSEAPFVFAARWPSRLRNEILNPTQPVTFVADGDSLAVYALAMGQYMVQAAPHIVPGEPATGEFAAALQPLTGVMKIARGVAAVTDAGPDTVLTATGPVNCRKLQLEYAPDTTRHGITMLPRTLWVEPARGVLWRDEIRVRVEQPGQPAFTSVQSMRFVSADLASGGPDSLYRISPPAGLERVSRFGPPPPPPPAIVGKPATDFTLPLLSTGARVRLGALRGKVVVLDFWATWCGPCRRWMPIVAKLEKELRGRDVRFFAVNERDTPDKVQAFLKTTGVSVPVLLDRDGHVGQAYDASSIPLTVIVGRDGKVVDALIGLHPEEDLRAALRTAGVKGM